MNRPSIEFADLEFNLRRGEGETYHAAMRFSQPGSDTDVRLGQAGALAISLDLPALQAETDPAEYGRLLSRSLFANGQVLAGFQQARAAARAADSPLRVRLLIDPGAPELNALYWETLRDPDNPDLTLFTGESVYFSRYLASLDWSPVKLREKAGLRALVAIADPTDLGEYGLAAVRLDEEFSRARAALGDIPVTALPAGGKGFCTLEAVIGCLREGYDILYLVAHGAFVKGEGWLFLQGEDGRVARVSAGQLVSFIHDLGTKPRLIVLASCQSAGRGSGQALQALGPRLAEAGVPAVIAMQGSVSMDTVARFMPVFFSELQKEGGIDRAASVARGMVREAHDFWMPALFMRLKSGRIWAEETARPSSAAPRLHQLPPPPADFTGRAKEIGLVLADFEKGRGAMVSGMGGTGKTALSLMAAMKLTEKYPEAQIYLDLKGTTTPLEAADAMRHVVLSFEPETDLRGLDEAGLAAAYRNALYGRKALLFFDNARSTEQVSPLVPPEPCGMLVTSRWIFRVAGLSAHRVDMMSEEDARLYLLGLCPRIGDRADELAAACGRLPLALKIAGSFLDVNPNRSVEKYLAELKDRSKSLKTLQISRQEAELAVGSDLTAAFDLSYAQLDEAHRGNWRKLGVFPSSFRAEAAGSLWDLEEEPALVLLGRLGRYNLLDYNENTDRYDLHDLLAEYALGQMEETEREETFLRHAGYYAEVLNTANEWLGQGHEKTLDGLTLYDAEFQNIQAGQAWAASHPDREEAARVCSRYADAGSLLGLRLHPRRQIEWLEDGLKAARSLRDRKGESFHLGNLGNAFAALGEARTAIEVQEQALDIKREVGDRLGEGIVLANLGNVYLEMGETEKAIGFQEQALVIARELGDRPGEGAYLGNLGNAHFALEKHREAIVSYEQALEIAREFGDRRGEGINLGNLGAVYESLGETEKAIGFHEQYLAIVREMGDRRGEGTVLGNLGAAYTHLGETGKAIAFREQALEIAREVADRRGEEFALRNLGNIYLRLNQAEKASGYFNEALEIARELGDRPRERTLLIRLGNARLALGEAGETVPFYEQALVIARETGDRREEAFVLGSLGAACADLGEHRKVIEYCGQALVIDRELGDREGEASDLGNLANASASLGEFRKAAGYYEEHLELARKLGDRAGVALDLGSLGNVWADLGEPRKAVEYYEKQLEVMRELGSREGEGNALYNKGTVLYDLGEKKEAATLVKQALAIFEEVKSPVAESAGKKLAEWEGG